MLDITLRPLKDRVFGPLCDSIPQFISPTQVTLVAFLTGLLCCICACYGEFFLATSLWILNRVLDCVDGSLARRRNLTSDLGGFLDLLSDFIVYSLIPISCAIAKSQGAPLGPTGAEFQLWLWLPIALLEASFHVNNFVLLYISAIIEKKKSSKGEEGIKELTSVAMKPALVEGTEAGLLFTVMLIWPQYINHLSWLMTGLVTIGIVQRTLWLIPALKNTN